MKKTLLKLAFLMLVFTAVFIACQKNFEAMIDNGSMTVDDAMLWYKAHLPDKLILKSGSSEKLPKVVMPDWKSAFKSGNDKVEVVESNLLS